MAAASIGVLQQYHEQRYAERDYECDGAKGVRRRWVNVHVDVCTQELGKPLVLAEFGTKASARSAFYEKARFCSLLHNLHMKFLLANVSTSPAGWRWRRRRGLPPAWHAAATYGAHFPHNQCTYPSQPLTVKHVRDNSL